MSWVIAIGISLAMIAALPWAIMAAKRSVGRGGMGAGAALAIGMAFSVLFDPRKHEVIEHASRRRENADRDLGGMDRLEM